MAKKNKFLSWLGLGNKKNAEEKQKSAQETAQAERLEQEKIANQEAENARIEAERLVKEKAAAQDAENARIEAERLAKEKAAAQDAENARIEAERLAKENAAAQDAENARVEAERLAKEKAAAQHAENARIEAERLAKENAAAQDAENARIKAERLAKENAAAQDVENARVEAERLAKENAAAQDAENARVEAERLAKENAAAQDAENARIEAERLAKENAAAQDAENARIEAERLAKEKEAAQNAENARIEAERLAKEKAAAQDAENARIEAERLAKEKAAAQDAENARIEAERLAKEKAVQDAENARIEAERLAKEKVAAQDAENVRIEAERLAKEKAAAQDAENVRIEAERLAKENAAALDAEKLVSEPKKKQGFFSKLKNSLLKTKQNIGSGFTSIFSGKKIDDDLFEELETQLLTADLGVDTTLKLIDGLTKAADRKQLKDAEALYEILKQDMANMLEQAEKPLNIEIEEHKPFVILMVGVNGVGKTTTIGKLAKQFQEQGKSVMLAAGDTFRAAAVEQLQVWGERNDIPVVAQHTGADSASVVFDAFQAAQARKVDVLIADTAGRLQNKEHLMTELEKISRVMKKLDANAPHEVMLTIDAGTGQNAISQVDLFDKAVGLTGITLTKLDGTAKGGVIFAVADKFNIPIRYIGVGEGIDDLRPFKSKDFIDALFSQDSVSQSNTMIN